MIKKRPHAAIGAIQFRKVQERAGEVQSRVRADVLTKIGGKDGARLSVQSRAEIVAGFASTLNDAHGKFPLGKRTYCATNLRA